MPRACISKSALLCVEDAVEQGHEHPFVVHVEKELIDAFEGAARRGAPGRFRAQQAARQRHEDRGGHPLVRDIADRDA